MHIRNVECVLLTPVFWLHNIHLEFSISCPHKFKWILCTNRPVLNTSFQDLWCTNISNQLIGFDKDEKNMYLNDKNSYHTKKCLSFNTNQILKYTMCSAGTLILCYDYGYSDIWFLSIAPNKSVTLI